VTARGPAGLALATAAGLWLLTTAGSPAEQPTGPDEVIHANNRGAALMEQYQHAQAV